MTEKTIAQLERDVETSRAKLADNLTTLRSPGTYAQFSGALRLEARDVQRDVLAGVRDRAEGYLEDLKGRAAANPAAVLALAAGVAWRFFQKPPIATALFGAGLYSLFRTPSDQIAHDGRGYLDVAKDRLKEQTVEFGSAVRDRAVSTGEAIAEKSVDLAGDATAAVGEMAQSARQGVVDVAERLGGRSADMFAQSRHAVSDAAIVAERKAEDIRRSTVDTASDYRDQILLGAAGVAVVAALGISLQRRFDEERHPGRLQ